jgi:tetratricopeptide (TPR) repeat protein
MHSKIRRIFTGLALILSLQTSQLAWAAPKINNHQPDTTLIADASFEINFNIDTPDKHDWWNAFVNARMLIQQGKAKEAMPDVQQAIRSAEAVGDNFMIWSSYLMAGVVYEELNDDSQVLNSMNSALAAAKQMRGKQGKMMEFVSLFFMIPSQLQQNDAPSALKTLEAANKLLRKFDQTQAKAIKPAMLAWSAQAHNASGDYTSGLQLTEQALQALPEAEKAYKTLPQDTEDFLAKNTLPTVVKTIVFWQQGIAYEKLGQPEKSCSLYRDAIRLAEQDKSKFLPKIQKSAAALLPSCRK